MREAAGLAVVAAGSIAQNSCRVGIGIKTLIATDTVGDSGKTQVKGWPDGKLL